MVKIPTLHLLIGALLVALQFATLPVRSAVNPHEYPATITDQGLDWQLSGKSQYNFKGIIPLYTTALYVIDLAHATRMMEDVPKRLVISYLRGIPGEKMITNGDRTLRENLTPEQARQIWDRVERMNAQYGDVKENDQYVLQYIPGVGTQLWFRGVLKDTIPGEDFGSWYFAIWLGEKPVSEKVRDTLMGKR